MHDNRISTYASMADAMERGPQTYQADAAVTALRAFRAHHPAARVEMITHDGRAYWMTAKMLRIHGVMTRHAVIGQMVKVRDVAAECRVSPGYVSKVIGRLQAWGMLGVISIRGRLGGLYAFARAAGDGLDHYAAEAKAHIRTSKIMATARALRAGKMPDLWARMMAELHEPLNVSSVYARGNEGVRTEETFSDADEGDDIMGTSNPFGAGVVRDYRPDWRGRRIGTYVAI